MQAIAEAGDSMGSAASAGRQRSTSPAQPGRHADQVAASALSRPLSPFAADHAQDTVDPQDGIAASFVQEENDPQQPQPPVQTPPAEQRLAAEQSPQPAPVQALEHGTDATSKTLPPSPAAAASAQPSAPAADPAMPADLPHRAPLAHTVSAPPSPAVPVGFGAAAERRQRLHHGEGPASLSTGDLQGLQEQESVGSPQLLGTSAPETSGLPACSGVTSQDAPAELHIVSFSCTLRVCSSVHVAN